MLRLGILNIIFGKEKDLFRGIRKITGYIPEDISLYKEALTHKSASYLRNGIKINNERLEYLGDSILDAVVSDYLYKKYRKSNEGFLTEMRSKIVNGEQLKELAVKLKIANYISQRININVINSKIYEDAFEAFIGAVYLDKGYGKVYKFIEKRVIERYIDIELLRKTNTNYKSQLIEWSQKTKSDIRFVTESCKKKSNSKMFVSQLLLDNKKIGKGKAVTKKEAEQKAAYRALILLGEIEVKR